MIAVLFFFLDSSKWVFDRIIMLPRPVVYACRIPSVPQIVPPVGKSGPDTSDNSSSVSSSGSSISLHTAAESSFRLCGGILVAMPTAIPDDPLSRSVGSHVNSTVGSSNDSSKLVVKSTVSFSISCRSDMLILVIRASVYRIAAALSPSTDP